VGTGVVYVKLLNRIVSYLSISSDCNLGSDLPYFYRAMLSRARYCYGNSSVCLSVCDVEISWSHIISWRLAYAFFSLFTPTSRICPKTNTPKFWPDIRVIVMLLIYSLRFISALCIAVIRYNTIRYDTRVSLTWDV